MVLRDASWMAERFAGCAMALRWFKHAVLQPCCDHATTLPPAQQPLWPVFYCPSWRQATSHCLSFIISVTHTYSSSSCCRRYFVADADAGARCDGVAAAEEAGEARVCALEGGAAAGADADAVLPNVSGAGLLYPESCHPKSCAAVGTKPRTQCFQLSALPADDLDGPCCP